MRRSHSEMADEMEKMSLSKLWWLNAFSQGRQKRPDHEIETRRMEHEVLCQAAADYRPAANRSAA